MSNHFGRFRLTLPLVLGLVCLGGLPAASEAGWLGFRNDTRAPILIQGAAVDNHKVRPCRPQLLYPGEVAWTCIVRPGTRLIIISDPKADGRVLYRGTLVCGDEDQFFSIQHESPSQNKLVTTSLSRPPR